MNLNRIVPQTSKRLISSTFHFERPITPPTRDFSVNSDETTSLKENPVSSFSDQKFRNKIRFTKMTWIILSILMGVWLVVLSSLSVTHLLKKTTKRNEHNEIYVGIVNFECSSDSDCSSTEPYCDSTYSLKCSQCTSSSHCTDSTKPICDIFGTRACHGCLTDRDCPGTLICDYTETRTCISS